MNLMKQLWNYITPHKAFKQKVTLALCSVEKAVKLAEGSEDIKVYKSLLETLTQ